MVSTEILFTVHTQGQIVAIDLPEAIYLRDYAAHFCEWVNGTVIKMSPVHERHDALVRYLLRLLEHYLELKPIGDLRLAPFVMRLELAEGRISNREPDIQLILQDNPHELSPTRMNGAADLVIEIVSTESCERDYGEKLHEYEIGGVQEYWIIDPLMRACRFYRRNEQGLFILQTVERDYQPALLPKLRLDTQIFWQDPLPSPSMVSKAIQHMLEETT